MKPHYFKLHLICALLLLSLSLSLAQSQNYPKNSSIDIEDGRQMQSKDSGKTFLLNLDEITVDFLPYEKNSFVYYSNGDGFFLRLAVSIRKTEKIVPEAFESAIRQGQVLKGRYWPEDNLEGEGQEILLEAKTAQEAKSNETHIFVECIFAAQIDQKGKYLIEITNQWEFKIQIAIFMGNGQSDVDSFTLKESQNFEYFSNYYTFAPRTFEMFTVRSGKWYLWVQSCGDPVDVTIKIGNKSTMAEIPNGGGSYFYQETIEDKSIEAREDRFRSVTLKSPGGDFQPWKRALFIHSVVINEPEFRNYELKEDPKNITVTYRERESVDPHETIIRFDPLKFQDPRLTGSVEYEIRLMEENWGYSCEEGLQLLPKNYPEITVPIDHKEQLEVRLGGCYNSEYYIKINAFVKYESQTIRYFMYPIGYVNFTDPTFKEKTETKSVGTVALVFFVMITIIPLLCYHGFKKIVEWRGRRVVREHMTFEDEREGLEENASPNNVQRNDA